MKTLLIIFFLFVSANICFSQRYYSDYDLSQAFVGAKEIDLAKSDYASVLKLREDIGIPPPQTLVLVKQFKRSELPGVLHETFSDPNVGAVCINKRFVAVLESSFKEEFKDRLNHELVHAYISLVSPKELPFWFQEGSACFFSTGSFSKAYAQSSEKIGYTESKVVYLNETYRQKLHAMQFLYEKSGKEKFYKWYKNAVITGDVDGGALLGYDKNSQKTSSEIGFPKWAWAIGAIVLIGVIVAGYFAVKNQDNYENL